MQQIVDLLSRLNHSVAIVDTLLATTLGQNQWVSLVSDGEPAAQGAMSARRMV